MHFGGHAGEAIVDKVKETLAAHPAHFGERELKERMSSVNVDGALHQGGPDHRHKSTSAAEKLWHGLHPSIPFQPSPVTCTTWDSFHRADIAFWRAIRQIPLLLEIFDISKQVDYMFGMGEGVAAMHAIGKLAPAELGVPMRVAAPGGTRKVGHMEVVARDSYVFTFVCVSIAGFSLSRGM